MYCPQCGAKVAVGSQFCSRCGSPLGQGGQVAGAHQGRGRTGAGSAPSPTGRPSVANAEREAARARFELASAVREEQRRFEPVRSAYESLSPLAGEIDKTRALLARHGGTILGVVLAALGMTPVIYGIATSQNPDSTFQQYNLPSVIVGCLIMVAGALVPLAFALAVRALRRNRVMRAQRSIKDACDQIARHYRSVPEPLCSVDNSDPRMLAAIADIVEAGKADTIKEAVVRIDDERTQAASLNLQQAQLEEIRGAKHAAIAAGILAMAGGVMGGAISAAGRR